MPIHYDFDENARILIARMEGHLTQDEFIEYFTASSQDPRFTPCMGRLINLARALSFPASAEIPPVLKLMRERTTMGVAKFAIIAESPLSIGMANMFMGQAGLSDSFELFSDQVSALRWLTASR